MTVDGESPGSAIDSTVTCWRDDILVSLRLQDGTCRTLPPEVFQRSMTASCLFDGFDDAEEVRFAAPAGVVERWLECVERIQQTHAAERWRGSDETFLTECLRSADFMADEALLIELRTHLAGMLFGDGGQPPQMIQSSQGTPVRRERVKADIQRKKVIKELKKLPEHLAISVLRAAPHTLDHQLAVLPLSQQRLAIHAAFPGLAADQSLDIDCSRLSLTSSTAVLKLFATLISPSRLSITLPSGWHAKEVFKKPAVQDLMHSVQAALAQGPPHIAIRSQKHRAEVINPVDMYRALLCPLVGHSRLETLEMPHFAFSGHRRDPSSKASVEHLASAIRSATKLQSLTIAVHLATRSDIEPFRDVLVPVLQSVELEKLVVLPATREGKGGLSEMLAPVLAELPGLLSIDWTAQELGSTFDQRVSTTAPEFPLVINLTSLTLQYGCVEEIVPYMEALQPLRRLSLGGRHTPTRRGLQTGAEVLTFAAELRFMPCLEALCLAKAVSCTEALLVVDALAALRCCTCLQLEVAANQEDDTRGAVLEGLCKLEALQQLTLGAPCFCTAVTATAGTASQHTAPTLGHCAGQLASLTALTFVPATCCMSSAQGVADYAAAVLSAGPNLRHLNLQGLGSLSSGDQAAMFDVLRLQTALVDLRLARTLRLPRDTANALAACLADLKALTRFEFRRWSRSHCIEVVPSLCSALGRLRHLRTLDFMNAAVPHASALALCQAMEGMSGLRSLCFALPGKQSASERAVRESVYELFGAFRHLVRLQTLVLAAPACASSDNESGEVEGEGVGVGVAGQGREEEPVGGASPSRTTSLAAFCASGSPNPKRRFSGSCYASAAAVLAESLVHLTALQCLNLQGMEDATWQDEHTLFEAMQSMPALAEVHMAGLSVDEAAGAGHLVEVLRRVPSLRVIDCPLHALDVSVSGALEYLDSVSEQDPLRCTWLTAQCLKQIGRPSEDIRALCGEDV